MAARAERQQDQTFDWQRIEADLDAGGVAMTGPILSRSTCTEIAALYEDAKRFRSRIVMARHGFGQGEYQYFSHPLPGIVQHLRQSAYAGLAPIANRWNERLGEDRRYPPRLDAFLASCAAAGQTRPTPLLLRYRAGDFNCLHQDLYGALAFPFQMVVLLSEPGRDFSGGEFALVEQRPRMQSRLEVVKLAQGEGAIFAVRDRPLRGARGTYRVTLRHGVSRVRAGQRFTLGIIFHDAE